MFDGQVLLTLIFLAIRVKISCHDKDNCKHVLYFPNKIWLWLTVVDRSGSANQKARNAITEVKHLISYVAVSKVGTVG